MRRADASTALPRRRARDVLLASLATFSSFGCGKSCSSEATNDAGSAASAPAEGVSAPPSASPQAPGAPEPAIAAGSAADAGRPNEACTGSAIDLAVAVVDPRCAIGSDRAKALRAAIEHDAALARSLRQEGEIDADGRVLLRLVNGADRAIALPLSWHPKLPAFTALVEDESHALYELEAPKLEPPDAGGPPRARFAEIVLAPKGVAVVHTRIGTDVVLRIAPSCAAGTCAPPKLVPGKYVLHVGELIADVEAGAPAKMDWRVR